MFKGLVTDETGSKRHVTMAGAGEIGDLRSFTQCRLEQQSSILHAKKVSSAALTIQICWKRFQAQRQLAFLLTAVLYKYSHGEPHSIYHDRFSLALILIKTLPLSLQWRQDVKVGKNGSILDDLAGEKIIYKPTQSEIMELLLQGGNRFAKTYVKYFVHDQKFLDWFQLIDSKLALPPIWKCVGAVYLRAVDEAPMDLVANSLVVKALLQIHASIRGWKNLEFRRTCCDCPDITQSETTELLGKVLSYGFSAKSFRLSVVTLLKLATQSNQHQNPVIFELIVNELLRDEHAAANWCKLSEAIQALDSEQLQIKSLFGVLLYLARTATPENTKKWHILLRSTKGLMQCVESFKCDKATLNSPLSQTENAEVAKLAFRYACDVGKLVAKIPKNLMSAAGGQFPNLLPLLMLAISNVKLEANDSLRVTMREPALLKLLFSFEDRDEIGLMSRLKIVFPPTNLSRFITKRSTSFASRAKSHGSEGSLTCMKLVIENFLNGSFDEQDDISNDGSEDESANSSASASSKRSQSYFGFVEPLDLTVFDNLILSTQLPKLLLARMSSTLFDKCNGSIVKFVDCLGPPPSFNSDDGLICKCFIDLILRMFLLVDDSRFGDCAMMKQENSHLNLETAKSVWTGIEPSIFPLKADQLYLLGMFIKHLSFSLISVLENWAYSNHYQVARRSLAKITLSEMSTLTRDVANLSTLLFKRGRRLEWRSEYGEIKTATQLLRAKTNSLNNNCDDEIFGDSVPPLRGSVPELIVKILSLIPHSVPFNDRVLVFNEILKEDRLKRGRTDVFTPFNAQSITIRRSHLVDDAISVFSEGSVDFKAALKVRFIDAYGLLEQGIDGGGLFREFLTLVSRELFSPEKGLFRLAGDESLLPNNAAYELLKLEEVQAEDCYRLAGAVVGKALFETLPLGAAELNPLFLNRVMGGTNTFDDLKYADIELYKNIKFVRDYGGDVSDLGLTFSATTDVLVAEQQECPLVVNGDTMKVTSENKIQYCLLLSHFLANKVMDRASQAFLSGLTRSIDISWLHLFDAVDVQYLISGRKQLGFDVEDLRNHTVYASPYSDSHPLMQALWAYLRESAHDFQAKFLHFVTASDRMPLLGFGSLNPPFSVVASGMRNELPSASTCINVLRLPEYSDAQTMRTKLKQAVEGTAGFYLA